MYRVTIVMHSGVVRVYETTKETTDHVLKAWHDPDSLLIRFVCTTGKSRIVEVVPYQIDIIEIGEM